MKKLFAFFLLLVVFIACSKQKEDESQPTPTPMAAQRHVEYRIECSDCQVMYYNAQAQTVNEYHKNNSWSFSFDGKAGDVVLLFAYNTDSIPQGVTACIKLNNDTLVSRTTYCPISGYSFVTDTLK